MYSISYKKGIVLVRENYTSPAFVWTKGIHLHRVKFRLTQSNGFATGWINKCDKTFPMPSYPKKMEIYLRKISLPTTTGYPLIYKDKKFKIKIMNQWCEVLGGTHLIIENNKVRLFSPIFK